MKLKIIPLISVFILTTGCSATTNTQTKVLKEENKKFIQAFGPVKFADAYGSRQSGPHGTYVKFPAGFKTPSHIHTHSYRAIVIKGEMMNPFTNELNTPLMKPGSYWAVKAGERHTTECISVSPCEFFMYGNESFDFIEKK